MSKNNIDPFQFIKKGGSSDKKDDKSVENIAKSAGAKAGADAGKTVGTNMAINKGLQFLQSLLDLGKSVAMGILNSIVSTITGLATSIATALGISTLAAMGGIVATTVLTAIGVASLVFSMFISSEIQRLEGEVPCKDKINLTSDVTDVEGNVMDVAKKLRSVLKGVNIPDVNIAGALGNIQAESELDPTCVETIYNEPFAIGPRKKKAEEADFLVSSVAPSYGRKYRLIKRVGIGLTQWTDTNDGATENTDLRNFAKSANKNWYDLDIQLAFMISGHEGRSKRLLKWTKPEKSPESAAYWFAKWYEGNTTMAQDKRRHASAQWFVKLKEMEVDKSYADTVIALAGTMASRAADSANSAKLDDCKTAQHYNNSDLVSAALSLSWPQYNQSYNYGTELYKSVRKKVAPGDPYILNKSCDSGVNAIVRWAGADDKFPVHSTAEQYQYMMTSPKWEKIQGWTNKSVEKGLQPGDVCVAPRRGRIFGHVYMYLGPDAIKQHFGSKSKPDTDFTHASYGERSLAIDKLSGMLSYDNRQYTAFRLKSMDTSSKYKGVTGGKASNGTVPNEPNGNTEIRP
jgi:hypothetical protein